MLIRTLAILSVMTCACIPSAVDEQGAKCDARRPCGEGYTCVAEACAYNVEPRELSLIALGSTWRYWDKGSEPSAGWKGAGFDDGAWPTGMAPLGYGNGDERTVVSFGPDPNSRYPTTYFRYNFDVPNPRAVSELRLRIQRDDGAVVYVNGVEVLRSNVSAPNPTYSTFATAHLPSEQERLFVEASFASNVLTAGTNVVAAEVHQDRRDSSDLLFEGELKATTFVSR